MKISFLLDLATCFRRGINVTDPVAHLEIDPGALSEDDRHLIADHLKGTTLHDSRGAVLTAEEPTLEGILQALRAEQEHERRRAETREAFQGPPRLVQPSKKLNFPADDARRFP